MLNRFRKYIGISIFKTLRMNWYYFGLVGVMHLYILAARSLDIIKLKGKIEIEDGPTFGCIRIGFGSVSIFDRKFERSLWSNSGHIKVKNKIHLGHGTRIANVGDLEFGKNFVVTANSSIICQKKIQFADDVLMSWDVLVMDTDSHKIYEIGNPANQTNKQQDIYIGEHCWIGCRTLILKGTKLEHDTVVAAGSVIRGESNISNCVIGNNNRVLHENIIWEY